MLLAASAGVKGEPAEALKFCCLFVRVTFTPHWVILHQWRFWDSLRQTTRHTSVQNLIKNKSLSWVSGTDLIQFDENKKYRPWKKVQDVQYVILMCREHLSIDFQWTKNPPANLLEIRCDLKTMWHIEQTVCLFLTAC